MKAVGRYYMLKKLNAVTALLAAVLLALHNTLNARMMILGRVDESPKLLAYALIVLFSVHMLVSLYVLIFRNEGRKIKYTNISFGWLMQRITALAMIPLVFFHGFVRAGQFGIGLIPILIVHFFIMLLAYTHIPLSVPNALVTLGIIDTGKQHSSVRIVCMVICALLFMLGLFASITEVIAL